MATMRFTATLAALLLLLAGCSARTETTPSAAYTPEVHTYAYYVTGTATSADVTYSTASGTQQATGVDLPLKNNSGTYGILMDDSSAPDFLYISAQNGDDYGEVSCRIMIDGVTVAQNTSSGGYAIVTCQASR